MIAGGGALSSLPPAIMFIPSGDVRWAVIYSKAEAFAMRTHFPFCFSY